MKILWLSWKDRSHPLAGGAEVVNEELAKRLVQDGHEVIFLVAGFPGSSVEEKRNTVPAGRQDFSIVRVGGRFSVYWNAYRYYKNHLQNWPDIVIDEMNTIPFFVRFYVKQKNILFVHQLARQIWFYQMPFPLSVIGYVLEPLYLRLLNKSTVVTVSNSTRRDLMHNGFKQKNIHIISEGIELEPISSLNFDPLSFNSPVILSLGAIRAMKRTGDILKAFEIIKASIPNARLVVAGVAEDPYGRKVIEHARASRFASDIEILGKVSEVKKIELLQSSHVLAVTSVKEGWGLVVTEANSQGTPAVVYNADGLRDSVRDDETGHVCKHNTPEDLAAQMVKLLQDEELYKRLQKNAWRWSKEITFGRSYKEFLEIITNIQS